MFIHNHNIEKLSLPYLRCFDRIWKSAGRPKSRGSVYRRLIFTEASFILRLSVSPGQLDLLQDVI
jgi:hypothetical protein